jgi:hypothetical protein
MNTFTKIKPSSKSSAAIASRSTLGVVLLCAMLVSTASYADEGPATDLATQSAAVDNIVTAAIDPAINAAADQVAVTAAPLHAPDAVAAGPGGMLSIVASGAGALLLVGLLGLAAINSRKRPLRLLKAQPQQDSAEVLRAPVAPTR